MPKLNRWEEQLDAELGDAGSYARAEQRERLRAAGIRFATGRANRPDRLVVPPAPVPLWERVRDRMKARLRSLR